jgi:hypothetical protein
MKNRKNQQKSVASPVKNHLLNCLVCVGVAALGLSPVGGYAEIAVPIDSTLGPPPVRIVPRVTPRVTPRVVTPVTPIALPDPNITPTVVKPVSPKNPWQPVTTALGELRLALDLFDGSSVVGIPAVAAIPLRTAVGEVSLPLDQIASLTFNNGKEGASVTLLNGDKLTGALNLTELRVTALYGQVSIPAKLIRKLACTRANAEPPRGITTTAAADPRPKMPRLPPGIEL